MNHVKVLLFAILSDKAGARSVELDVSATMTIGELKGQVVARYPALGGLLETSLASINQEYCDDEAEVPGGAEVAFFPPVSGGLS